MFVLPGKYIQAIILLAGLTLISCGGGENNVNGSTPASGSSPTPAPAPAPPAPAPAPPAPAPAPPAPAPAPPAPTPAPPAPAPAPPAPAPAPPAPAPAPPAPAPPPPEASFSSVTLTWSRPTSYSDGSNLTSVSGYKIYYGTASGMYTELIDTGLTANATLTNIQVNNLLVGEEYFFSITAYDNAGNESENSREVSLIIS